MTDRQKQFVLAYIGRYAGDSEAAYLSVYKNCKPENAKRRAEELLKKAEIAELLTCLNSNNKKIATTEEIQAYLTQIMRGEVSEDVYDTHDGKEYLVKKAIEVHPRDRLKAAELLGKVQGVFTEHDEEKELPKIIDDI